ncbi:protein phosphatase 2C domain-containing protein [Haloarcula amylovorans]|uniref:protein phosphatase 2C domain-containing protein n=1 Tax=Haloarcula amylovorans TaxID=2562280 RepID=UPI0010761A86|nr:protein phosphatase 2C domain-containing protein [Halomicroarcula amylolytica]
MGPTATEAGLLTGCSVIGPKHVRGNLPNQDAWCAERLDDGRFVIAVSDGLGEAEFSQVGSEQATSAAIDSLKKNLESVDRLDTEAAEEPIREAITTARTAVADKAAEMDEQPTELDTTLLVTVAGPTGIAGAAVGDGGIICADGDTYPLLVPREEAVVNLPASHYTIPIMRDNWEDSYRFGTRDSFDGVAVFSDGLENFTWSDLESARTDFFDSIFALVRDHDDPDSAAETLIEILESHPYNEFGDDKTIVIADLPPGFEDDKVRTESGEVRSLGEPLGYRTNSSVFRLEGSDTDGVNLYTPEKRNEDGLEAKIQAMVENPPKDASTADDTSSSAWPLEAVRSEEDGQFVGYRFSLPHDFSHRNVLEVAETFPSDELGQDNRSRGLLDTVLHRLGFADNRWQDDRYDLALGLAELVASVHQRGHALGNLHHETFLIDGTRVYWSGCEDVHVVSDGHTFESRSAPERYQPPEGTGTELDEVQRSDHFGLAVHIFQLLMDGHHPYEAEGTAATDGAFAEITRSNHFPYRDPQPDQLEPPADSPSYTRIPTHVRTLFERCFIEGKVHPEVRPTAKEWVASFESGSNRKQSYFSH